MHAASPYFATIDLGDGHDVETKPKLVKAPTWYADAWHGRPVSDQLRIMPQ
jgi:hypothetical protein